MDLRNAGKYILALSLGLAYAPIMADQPAPAAANAQADAKKEEKKKPSKEELFSQANIDRLSETYGFLIQKSLNNPVVKLNPKAVIQGIQSAEAGKTAPMSEKDYEEALQQIQQYAYEDMANKNLSEAEAYLKKNASEQGVISLDNGKLQYKVMQPGTGETVTEDMMPTINYNASFSNGQKLGSSEQSGGPIDIQLDQTIPGFRQGIVGMKVGEKRRIFIHPDLGYGKSGQLPNGLLIFDIEVTKVSPKPAAKAEAENEDDDDDDLSDLIDSDDDDDVLADLEDDEDFSDDDDDDELDLEEEAPAAPSKK